MFKMNERSWRIMKYLTDDTKYLSVTKAKLSCYDLMKYIHIYRKMIIHIGINDETRVNMLDE